MWCTNCQQDVPAAAQAGTRKSVCVRCGSMLRPPHAVQLCEDGIELDEEACVVFNSAPPLATNEWDAQRQTREISRKLRREFGGQLRQPHNVQLAHRRLDPPQNLFDDLAQLT